MAGIYIHVPFCKQACRYCDFYFTVSLKYQEPYLTSLLKEIQTRRDFTGREVIETIYFGGGTPSVLTSRSLSGILEKIHENYEVSEGAEITLEANPDDLTPKYLQEIRETGFNRLSIGVQSFHQDELSLMRRSHTNNQAKKSIINAANAGFKNMNMDLIYGVPGLTLKKWENNLNIIHDLPVQHISAYHLTFESGTVFDHWRKQGKLKEVEESVSVEQYSLLKEVLGTLGFEHYEVSNFALPGFESRHNTSYWENKTYLGLGPAAHSFNGKRRSWNISSLKEYIRMLEEGVAHHDGEELTEKEMFNDYLIISLRTRKGIDLDHLKREFGNTVHSSLLKTAQRHQANGAIVIRENKMFIPAEEWLRADMIVRDLIIT